MKKKIKAKLHDWLPPALIDWIIKVKGIGNRFEGDYASWKEADSECSGYNAKDILDNVLAATIKVKNGEAVYERDSVIFDEIEYSWPVTSTLMWVAARNNGHLNVLDFGGSLGSSYFQNRKFLQALPHVSWSVVEQPHYVEAGQQYIQDGMLKFYKTISESIVDNQPNVVLLSSVLQYLDKPQDIIKQLTATKATCLIIDRTPFSSLDTDKILVQRVPASIYSASYPMRVFSLLRLLKILEPDWDLVTLVTSPEGEVKSTSGFSFSFQGLLLELRK